MKTFSEACQEVFMVKVHKNNFQEAQIKLLDAQERRADLVKEVIASVESAGLLELLHEAWERDESMSMGMVVLNAFAQGVLVGMEMEKTTNDLS